MYTKKELWDHHLTVSKNHRAEVERMEKRLREANQAIAVLASMLADKADEAAGLFPDFDAGKES